jgi:hypothetical protein
MIRDRPQSKERHPPYVITVPGNAIHDIHQRDPRDITHGCNADLPDYPTVRSVRSQDP